MSWFRQRTQLSNSIRSYLAEFGLVAPQSPRNVAKLLEQMDAGDITELPAYAHDAIAALRGQLSNLTKQIDVLEAKIIADHREKQVLGSISKKGNPHLRRLSS